MGKEEPSDSLPENKRSDSTPEDRNPKQWSQEEAANNVDETSSNPKDEKKPAEDSDPDLEKTEPWITGRKRKD